MCVYAYRICTVNNKRPRPMTLDKNRKERRGMISQKGTWMERNERMGGKRIYLQGSKPKDSFTQLNTDGIQPRESETWDELRECTAHGDG